MTGHPRRLEGTCAVRSEEHPGLEMDLEVEEKDLLLIMG